MIPAIIVSTYIRILIIRNCEVVEMDIAQSLTRDRNTGWKIIPNAEIPSWHRWIGHADTGSDYGHTGCDRNTGATYHSR